MKSPREDPADKAARLRERRLSELELTQTTEKQAGGLGNDLASVFGLRSIPMFGKAGKAAPASIPGSKPTPKPKPNQNPYPFPRGSDR